MRPEGEVTVANRLRAHVALTKPRIVELLLVTTVPAAGNIALGAAFGAWHEVWGSTLQLTLNLVAMAAAGWATLALQQLVWARVPARRRTLFGGRPMIGRPPD